MIASITVDRALAEALALADKGLACFPCAANKHPRTPHGFKDASKDGETLQHLWKLYPGPLVGVATGELSGFDVLDIDRRHGGATWFTKHRGDLPPTRVHRTRSGGLHLFFQHKPGMRCSVGKIAPGVDVRADGGYVIWWPAIGLQVLSDSLPHSWPDWITQQSEIPAPSPRHSRVPDNLALSRLVRTVIFGKPGERNQLTFWAACRAGEMVASGLLDPDLAVDVLAEAAVRAGLPYKEARRTALSGMRTSGGRRHA